MRIVCLRCQIPENFNGAAPGSDMPGIPPLFLNCGWPPERMTQTFIKNLQIMLMRTSEL